MKGEGGNRFDPSANTTRAVLATILMRLDSLPKRGDKKEKKENGEMTMKINNTAVSVAWESNACVAALRELAANGPLSINMSMYGGFEQVGLPWSCARSLTFSDAMPQLYSRCSNKFS